MWDPAGTHEQSLGLRCLRAEQRNAGWKQAQSFLVLWMGAGLVNNLTIVSEIKILIDTFLGGKRTICQH